MELTNINRELYQAAKRLREGGKELFHLARERAEAEKAYRMALAKEIVMLKDAGQSVTLIGDIARGNTAEMKFARDLADARYSAGRDLLTSLQTEVSALQTIIKHMTEL